MQAAQAPAQPEFKGSKQEQELAAEAFKVTVASGRFFGEEAAISVALSALAEFYAGRDESRSAEEWASQLDRVLSASDHVFLRDERESGVFFVTTRRGIPPVLEVPADTEHSLASRFETPKPIPADRPARRAPQKRATPRYDDVVEPTRAEPAFAEEDFDVASIVEQALAEMDAAAAQEQKELVEAEAVSDLSEVSDDEIREALIQQLATDFSVAQFGDEWMTEDRVPRLSRGDSRRIRDYVAERGEPVTDVAIVQEVLGVRPNAQEYDLHRFAVNFRLSRESREFEFVGLPSNNLWSTTDLSLLPPSKRRPAELGQDFRVLLVESDDEVEASDEGVIEHVLTFYEHANGVLPYDSNVRAVLGDPVLPDQRAAILRIESPQNHESFYVELRFPTGNRGGYLIGFEEFFKEHLVPGAFLSLERGEEPGVFLIEYLPVSGQDRKILTLDEKKHRYKFETTTFYCAPDEDMLLTENRFPKLEGATPLEDRSRRRPEDVLAATFERIGEIEEQDGQRRFMAMLDELFCVANIERPMPASLIRQIASSPDHPAFAVDPEADDVIYYEPPASE
jgi:hypothetical protein